MHKAAAPPVVAFFFSSRRRHTRWTGDCSDVCSSDLGLGHSALGETQLTPVGRVVIAKQAVMFPIAFPAGTTLDRSLQQDDKAGIESVYGTPTFERSEERRVGTERRARGSACGRDHK